MSEKIITYSVHFQGVGSKEMKRNKILEEALTELFLASRWELETYQEVTATFKFSENDDQLTLTVNHQTETEVSNV